MKKVSDGVNQTLFQDASMNNPYAPKAIFSIPIRILDHDNANGRITVKYLDEIFKYVEISGISDAELDDDSGTPHFKEALKKFLVSTYATSESLSALVNFLDENNFEALANVYEYMLELNAEQGFDRSSLDTSIALIFGNSTTVGQVCAYARGLEDGTVDDMPGFCCLDAPYELDDWGEKVRKIATYCWKYRPAD